MKLHGFGIKNRTISTTKKAESFKLYNKKKKKIIKKEINWQFCPRCKSNKIQKRGKGFYFSTGFLTLCFSIWLLIIPPVGILGMLIGFGFIISSPFMPAKLYCKNCKFSWKFNS